MLDVYLDSGINVTNQILSHFLCGRHIYAIITVYQIDCDQGPAKRNFIRMYHGISIAIVHSETSLCSIRNVIIYWLSGKKGEMEGNTRLWLQRRCFSQSHNPTVNQQAEVYMCWCMVMGN